MLDRPHPRTVRITRFGLGSSSLQTDTHVALVEQNHSNRICAAVLDPCQFRVGQYLNETYCHARLLVGVARSIVGRQER